MYDYLIVGAGLFGSVFARLMTDFGKKCLVIDRRAHIGGNCYTELCEGIHIHKYGAHIFHTSDKEVWNFINRFADFNNFINSPVAVYENELYNLPFNMNTFYQLWGTKTPDEAKRKIAEQTAPFQAFKPQNLEEQALSFVGTDIYKKLIKEYTEKQWGRPCTELPSSIITRIPLRLTYNNNYFDDCYQGIPIGGYTAVFEKLLNGIEVRLNTAYSDIRHEKVAPKTVFCGGIDEFFDYCLGELSYRTVRFENKILDTDNFQGNAVVNYTSRDIPYTRIIEHKHFEDALSSRTVITREYPQNWQRDSEPFYPINDAANNELYRKYIKLAADYPDVIFGGRLGLYRYLDMDDTIRIALELAKKETEQEIPRHR